MDPVSAEPATEHEVLLTLFDLGRQVTSVLELQELLPKIPELIARLIPYDAFGVYLYDERRDELRLEYAVGYPDREARFRLRAGEGIVGRAVKMRQPVVVGNAADDPHYIEVVPGMVSDLVVPMTYKSQSVGALNVLSRDRDRFGERDVQILRQFGAHVAVALENARLFDELHQKQSELIRSSKLAAVGTFAAGIAHEFNNLLGGMLGYAQLGRAEDAVDEKNKALDVVVQACVRGRSITRGLLTFARRSEHRRELNNVADAIDETMTLVEIDIRKANIEVVRQIEPVPQTVCDLGQIAQVVLNLVTNARDAMRPDGGTLTIGLRERNGAVELSVADTGAGIAEEVRERLFEPFVTTKGELGGTQTPGTGLGLSISYGIVKDHGGEILVDSRPGAGTTMTVRLPITT
jgi:two-component system, NtrC family, sensor kinase